MRTVLWILQVLLAAAFFAHGLLLLFPPAAIANQMNASLPRWFQLFIGALILVSVGAAVDSVHEIRDEHRREAQGSGVDPHSRLPGDGPKS